MNQSPDSGAAHDDDYDRRRPGQVARDIGGLAMGEVLVITQGDKVVARIVDERSEPRSPRVAGFARGMMTIVAEDDEHLKDFAEYMP